MLFCALAFVVAFAATAYAEVQNVKVSGDLSISGVMRNGYDLTKGISRTNQSDSFYVGITRVKVEADLTDNVQATVRLLNERVWEAETSANTDIDLDLAYLTLKEFLYSPLTLTLGRQNLRYGNALIVGDPDTNAQVTGSSTGLKGTIAEDLSVRKAFDALKATFDYAPWTIDLVTAKISEVNKAGGTHFDSQDEDLYGVNAGYKFASYNASAEGYFFAKRARAEAVSVATTTIPLTQAGNINNLGLRGMIEPIKDLGLTGEVAYQFGKATKVGTGVTANRDQKAWALDLDGTYTFENQYAPMLGLGYSYRSGQNIDKSTGDYKAWNVMYEDQTQGVVADYLLSGVNGGVNSNASIIKASGSIKPVKDITLGAKYYNYRLTKTLVAAGSTTGTVTYASTNLGSVTHAYTFNNKKELGNEIDLLATYDYTTDVQFGLTAGWFSPGKAFNNVNNQNASSIIGSVKVVF